MLLSYCLAPRDDVVWRESGNVVKSAHRGRDIATSGFDSLVLLALVFLHYLAGQQTTRCHSAESPLSTPSIPASYILSHPSPPTDACPPPGHGWLGSHAGPHPSLKWHDDHYMRDNAVLSQNSFDFEQSFPEKHATLMDPHNHSYSFITHGGYAQSFRAIDLHDAGPNITPSTAQQIDWPNQSYATNSGAVTSPTNHPRQAATTTNFGRPQRDQKAPATQ